MLLGVCILFVWCETVKSWTITAANNVTEDQSNSSVEVKSWSTDRSETALTQQTTSTTVHQVPPSVTWEIGIAALVLSVLALVLILVTVLWLTLHKAPSSTLANLAKANNLHSANPSSQLGGGPPKISPDTNVYMNYTPTNESYTNLDPTSMDGVYARMF